jgi:hypothetical protein
MKKYTVLLGLYFLFSVVTNLIGQTPPPAPMWIATFKSISNGNTKTFSGTADHLSHFKQIAKKNTVEMQNDQIAVELKFLSTDVVITDTLSYSKAVDFYENHSSVLSDCDEYDFYYGYGGSKHQWSVHGALESNIDETWPAQGKGSFHMTGTTGYSGNKQLACFLSRQVQTGDFIKNTAPDNTWISFYVKNDKQTTSILRIGVWQREEGTLLSNYYYTDIPLNFTGWQYFAVPYSELIWVKTDDIIRDNTEKNCNNIKTIHYSLYCAQTNGQPSIHLDYLTLLFRESK